LFSEIFLWFRKLFGVKGMMKTETEQARETAFAAAYEDTAGFNIISIVANKLANIVCSEAGIELRGKGIPDQVRDDGDGKIDFMDECLQRVVNKLKIIVTRVLGTGGVILKPYVYGGRIYTDAVAQNRFFVIERTGEVITKAGFLAEAAGEYTRIEYHTLYPDGRYTVENRALKDGKEVPLSAYAPWGALESVLEISGVGRMLFAFLKCPVDGKDAEGDVYGVPVTFGQNALIGMICDLLNEVPDEYKNKKAFIGAEELLFDKNSRLPEDGLYKLFRANGGTDSQSFWEVFSPEIRHTSYFEGINYLLGLLEKAVAVNKGVLTDLDARDATATAIKRSMFDTYNFADACRKNIEVAVGDLVYAFSVIANAFGLCGDGYDAEYEIKYDWSYGLLEDSSETWKQLFEGAQAGAVKVEEMRMFLFDESRENARNGIPAQTRNDGAENEDDIMGG